MERNDTNGNATVRGLVCLLVSVIGYSSLAFGEEEGKVSLSAAVTSDYAGRGISQTFNKSALQAAIDISDQGWYAGAWASTIDDRIYEEGSVEVDLYTGYSRRKDRFTYDMGIMQYIYPGARNSATGNSYDFLEMYISLGVSPISIKYSEAVNDMNGLDGSKGFSYTELWFKRSFHHFSLAARAARKSFSGYDFLSHNDYLVSISKEVRGFNVALSYRDSNASKEYFSVQGNYLGGQIISLTLGKQLDVFSF